ncbi:MAG: TIGR00266 family protein [Thermomicrobiales bacterium]
MKVDVLYQPAYAVARVTLANGEPIRADSGAMVAMDSQIQIETKATGGFLKSISRSMLGGESFFQNTFTSSADGGQIFFAPDLPGDIITHELTGSDLLVQSGSYLVSDVNVQVDSKWGGAKTFFGGEGLFMLRCSGQGTLVMASFGAIHKATLEAGQRYTVDTGHIVAFPGGMQYGVRKVGNWKSTIFGGEGLVVDFTGPGDVFLQTRSPESFLGWLIPNLPKNSNN